MTKIKRLTEEIGFTYKEKPAETEKPFKKKKKLGFNEEMKAFLFMMKPILKEAHNAGKEGREFEDWWTEYTSFNQPSMEMPEEDPREAPPKAAMGFRH